MKQAKNKLWFYAMICCVYGIFFSVESFYNFDGGKSRTETCQTSVVKNTPTHPGATHGFRLNKRYHPEYNPPCPICSPDRPERRLPMLRLSLPGCGALPEIAIVHYSLRGPPTLA